MKQLKVEDFSPLWDNVIVRPFKLEFKEQWARPQNAEDKSELGEVVSVGKGTETIDITKFLKPGDIVLFNKYSSNPIDLGKELLIRAEDIVAVARK